MGCSNSKGRPKPGTQQRRPTTIDMSTQEETVEISQRKFDEKSIEQLRKDFNENFDMFLLNNILMSIMFYENFEDEILKAKTLLTKPEQDLNDKLIREHSKQCVMPDTLYDKVNQRVHFKRKHGPKKDVAEPLVPMRMFIIHDKIEILKESEDLDHYSGIDKPTHRVNVENSTHAGFVKLKLLYFPTLERCESYTSLNSGSSTYAHGQAALKNGYDKSQASTSSYSDSDEYDYSRVNQARTELPINITEKRSSSVGLPPGTIIEVKSKNLDRENDEDDMFRVDRYINSEAFMKYFRETDFPANLGKSLGFSSEEIRKATYTATSIYCCMYDISKEVDAKCEILPAVKNPFPDLKVFHKRDRPRIKHKDDNLIYVFPTQNMLKDICSQPSIVVPRGFLQKKGDNKDYKFEWETIFPRAERHIQVRMFHGQVRCFLFLIILHKMFIEPITQHKGLTVDHIRNLMYWECEKNYRNWPEHRLGNKMMYVLDGLRKYLSKLEMPDYFIEKKNMFCNIPGAHLYKAQEQIHRIIENPVLYAIAALRNVYYTNDAFYPLLDFDQLYKLITKKGEAERAAAPSAMRTISQFTPTGRFDPSRLTREQRWELDNMEKQREKKRKELEKVKNLKATEKRESVDSIDLKFSMNSYSVKESFLQQKTFLVFFMEHFLQIVKYSQKYKAWNQYSIYLDQVKYLNALLDDIDGGESQKFSEKIREADEIATEQREYTPPTPIIPARNSMHGGHTGVLLKNQMKPKTIDLTNVTKNFQMGIQKTILENEPSASSPTRRKEVRLMETAEVH
ncbi:uncharacterized protein [Onthophagus taurus]|uniref:uncharacterized protein n=1 Tax=Onthophagus taurus TaxID=166361 RepID=UPI000C201EF0|nr:uncharacterized protein LOC111425986 [Onthophagus taurus]